MGKNIARALLVAWGLVACTSSSTSGNADAERSGPLEAPAFANALAAAYCKAATSCCTAAKGAMTADCEAKIAGEVKAAVDKAASDPSLRYDATLAGKCVAAYRALPATCDELPNEDALADCRRVVDGLIAPGEACGEVGGCAAPEGPGYAGCGAPNNGTNRKCRQFRYVKEGDACVSRDADPFAEGPGVVGDCGPADLVCESGKCVAGPAVGQPCPSNICGPSAVCVHPAVTCAALTAKEGEACQTGRCAGRSLSCNNDKCERRTLSAPCAGLACANAEVCTR